MSTYAVVETGVVILIGLASAWQVMRVLAPRATQRLRAAISKQLNGGREDAHSLAGGQPETGARSGCGAGCGSGCNGCSVAAALNQSLADQRNPSH